MIEMIEYTKDKTTRCMWYPKVYQALNIED